MSLGESYLGFIDDSPITVDESDGTNNSARSTLK